MGQAVVTSSLLWSWNHSLILGRWLVYLQMYWLGGNSTLFKQVWQLWHCITAEQLIQRWGHTTVAYGSSGSLHRMTHRLYCRCAMGVFYWFGIVVFICNSLTETKEETYKLHHRERIIGDQLDSLWTSCVFYTLVSHGATKSGFISKLLVCCLQVNLPCYPILVFLHCRSGFLFVYADRGLPVSPASSTLLSPQSLSQRDSPSMC